MKTLIFLSIIFSSAMSFASTHNLQPGETYFAQEKGESITCAAETCRVTFKYVSKEYQVWTPKNEVFSSHKTTEEALSSAERLINLKVCQKLDIDYKEKK